MDKIELFVNWNGLNEDEIANLKKALTGTRIKKDEFLQLQEKSIYITNGIFSKFICKLK